MGTLLNKITWVCIVLTSPTNYTPKYISVHKTCGLYIHPSTKDKKNILQNITWIQIVVISLPKYKLDKMYNSKYAIYV